MDIEKMVPEIVDYLKDSYLMLDMQKSVQVCVFSLIFVNAHHFSVLYKIAWISKSKVSSKAEHSCFKFWSKKPSR